MSFQVVHHRTIKTMMRRISPTVQVDALGITALVPPLFEVDGLLGWNSHGQYPARTDRTELLIDETIIQFISVFDPDGNYVPGMPFMNWLNRVCPLLTWSNRSCIHYV